MCICEYVQNRIDTCEKCFFRFQKVYKWMNILDSPKHTAHNLHINAIFVYLLMQEFFIDKIHFFKFLSMSDKPRQRQFKIITSTLLWLFESFHLYLEIPSRKGKYPVLKTNTKPHQLIKHAKISYFILSPEYLKFCGGTYRNSLNRGT